MLNKFSDSIYYMPHQDENDRPTLGLVCGEHYSLIIDCGNSTQHAKDFLNEIKKLNVPPIKYAVITHAHWDHFLGMNEFDATVIVNNQTNELLKVWQDYSFDDNSLQTYVKSKVMSEKCVEIIQAEIPNRDYFKLKTPHIFFEKTLTLDLGNKIIILEKINSTHSDDATIIYVPDEKVIFLGDSVYGTSKNSLFHYKQSLLIPMIEDIEKYNAKEFLLGHESICNLEEMTTFWRDLKAASKAVNSPSLEDALESFKLENNRTPNNDELFFIKAFVNDYIIQSL
ncbi:MAG: MBL fold metallo-hydrolase [Solibacillus sp.]|uniref:MBL fold metallo-hydrolase n=1 Tax=Solibacillus sp. TaxID=1909654 RepID=UPI00331498F8